MQLDSEHASETQRIMRPPREIRLDLLKTISKLGDAPEADSTGSELSRGLAGHFAQRNFALHLGEFSCYAPPRVMQCEIPLTNVQRPTQTFRFMSEFARFTVEILLRDDCASKLNRVEDQSRLDISIENDDRVHRRMSKDYTDSRD